MSEIDHDAADVTIGVINGDWWFWESEYPEDMTIGPFASEAECRAGAEDFYKHNKGFV